jgi:hypothetical protein
MYSGAMSVTPGSSSSFLSVAGSQHSAPQLLPQQHQQGTPGKQQLLQQMCRHSDPGAPQQQQQQQQLGQGLDQGMGAGSRSAVLTSQNSTASLRTPFESAAAAGGVTSSSSSRNLSIWPSIKEETQHEHSLGQNTLKTACEQDIGSSLPRLQDQQQQQQEAVSISALGPLAAQQQQQQQQQQAALAAAAAAGLLRGQPIPPVTMVFMVVDGAKVFSQRRRQLVKDIHAQLSAMAMLALRHVPGGYMCRMQVSEECVEWHVLLSGVVVQGVAGLGFAVLALQLQRGLLLFHLGATCAACS